MSFELHGSLDGFGSSDLRLDGAGFASDSTWHAFNGLDASSLGTQSTAVTFRLHVYSLTDDSFGFAGLGNESDFADEGQNFRVNGMVVPVPGPTTLGIAAACVARLSWRRSSVARRWSSIRRSNRSSTERARFSRSSVRSMSFLHASMTGSGVSLGAHHA